MNKIMMLMNSLAMEPIEEMKEYGEVRVLLEGAKDIVERAQETLDLLEKDMLMPEWGQWFSVVRPDGYTFDGTWLRVQINGYTMRCSQCGAMVDGRSPRLRVDNDNGIMRTNSHGKRHDYLCADCAYDVYGTRPPKSYF